MTLEIKRESEGIRSEKERIIQKSKIKKSKVWDPQIHSHSLTSFKGIFIFHI